MKKSLITILGVFVLMLSSCSTVRMTSSSLDIPTSIVSESVADLEVSPQKITYKFVPNRSVRRGGYANVINSAISEALKDNGNADVMVAPQFETKVKTGFFGQKTIKYVIVKGYPAKYTNVKPVEPLKYVQAKRGKGVPPCDRPDHKHK